jgi:hypothetical protein
MCRCEDDDAASIHRMTPWLHKQHCILCFVINVTVVLKDVTEQSSTLTLRIATENAATIASPQLTVSRVRIEGQGGAATSGYDE